VEPVQQTSGCGVSLLLGALFVAVVFVVIAMAGGGL